MTLLDNGSIEALDGGYYSDANHGLFFSIPVEVAPSDPEYAKCIPWLPPCEQARARKTLAEFIEQTVLKGTAAKLR